MRPACTHVDGTSNLFCADCGRVKDPKVLKTVRLQGFTGPASLNSNVERFWETGDPTGV